MKFLIIPGIFYAYSTVQNRHIKKYANNSLLTNLPSKKSYCYDNHTYDTLVIYLEGEAA